MLNLHKKLVATLQAAEALAKEIDQAGGNVQGAIHSIRSATVQTGLRVKAYEAHAEAAKDEADKADADAEAQVEAKASAKSKKK